MWPSTPVSPEPPRLPELRRGSGRRPGRHERGPRPAEPGWEHSGTPRLSSARSRPMRAQHFGSRLVFDRDGNLFVTLGERFDLRDQAQNPNNHLGKIVASSRTAEPRRTTRSSNREDARPEIWSFGHRNVQSAALNPTTGELWTAEHGARGGDEVNIPQKGKNYGWPVISYGVDYSGAEDRRRHAQARHGAADLLLGSRRSRLRAWRSTPATSSPPGAAASSSARWRQARVAARDQRQQGRPRGADAAGSRRAHPRRAPGTGRLRLPAHRFLTRPHPADEARRIRLFYPRGPNRMIAAPARQNAAPARSQRSGRVFSTPQSHRSEATI